MYTKIYKSVLFALLFLSLPAPSYPQPLKIPDTGQTMSYTQTFGEDADYLINAPSFTNNGNGTTTDNVTGLLWQRTDGGEMTYENASAYCSGLSLGGQTGWRLPTIHELYTILNHSKNNPSLDTVYFTKTGAEYWWSSDKQIDDSSKIWVANAGGGAGAHMKSETISAGGTKKFHVLAVKNSSVQTITPGRFIDNGDGIITDLYSGLTWQKSLSASTYTWENALNYCESLTLAGYSDWRLPNIKELQSLSDPALKNPAISSAYFQNLTIGNYWSSTTLTGPNPRAWYMNTGYGLITYDDKTKALYVISVRGESNLQDEYPEMALIPGGEFVMGDHHGYIDPQHPSDELPLHTVRVDSFYIGKYELTNAQFCDYLNYAKGAGQIEVRNNIVYATGDTNIYSFTNQYASYSSIGWDGTRFSVIDFRSSHPLVGVMWYGAAAYCNWLSIQSGLAPCYNTSAWSCDFSKNGYRLPTEAEWEYAGRGGQYNPYFVFPWGNDSMTIARANWPASGDPYETGAYPYTTPVGFYNGGLRLKANYNWPGSLTSYQTVDGSNAYGLYDMSGNVWEFVNDWYGQNYYSVSPYLNPTGPASGFIMPDGKPYRGMRGGNWYNGQWGHSRVANRNPSYYRGPQDPNHPWYHIGFRVVRAFEASPSGVSGESEKPQSILIKQNYPNPFSSATTISFTLPADAYVSLKVYNSLGAEIITLLERELKQGNYEIPFNGNPFASGVLYYKFRAGDYTAVKKMILIK